MTVIVTNFPIFFGLISYLSKTLSFPVVKIKAALRKINTAVETCTCIDRRITVTSIS